MNKQQVIERLCKLVTVVGEWKFDNKFCHDCFCTESHSIHELRVDEEVVEFIENAVKAAIKNGA